MIFSLDDNSKWSGNGFKDGTDTNKTGTIEATYKYSYRQHDISSVSDTDEYNDTNNIFNIKTGDVIEKVCILFSISLLVIILIKIKEIICHLEKLDYNKFRR